MHLTPKSALVSFIENFMTHNSFHFTSFTTSINSCSNGTSLETMVIFKLMKQGDWWGEHHPSHVKCNSFRLDRLIVGIMPWVEQAETAKMKTSQTSHLRNHCVILLLPTRHHNGLRIILTYHGNFYQAKVEYIQFKIYNSVGSKIYILIITEFPWSGKG